MCMHSKMLTECDCFYCIRMKETGPAIVGTIDSESIRKNLSNPLIRVDRTDATDLRDQLEYIREHDGA